MLVMHCALPMLVKLAVGDEPVQQHGHVISLQAIIHSFNQLHTCMQQDGATLEEVHSHHRCCCCCCRQLQESMVG
jgi:hypothetical protein